MDIEKEILKEMGELKKLDFDADVQVEKVKEVVKDVVKEAVEEFLEQAAEIKKLTAAPIEELKEIKETVEETVEETIKEIKKITNGDISVIVRSVETTEFPKTFQCCLPFLSSFLGKKKSE
jgi:N-glycosylase/DNA lyase